MELRLERLSIPGYEQVVYAEHAAAGLRSIISIHNTSLGPACGGLRILPYATRAEALNDVLRLSKGMSYKSSLAGIGFGGGKSVIMLDPKQKTPELLEAFGAFVNTFEGKYITAKDMNVSGQDLKTIKGVTPYVLGIEGETNSSGDPSPLTARGVFRALEATVEQLNGSTSMKGVKVAIQGLGAVGFGILEWVQKAGGEVWATDLNQALVEKLAQTHGVHPVAGEDIYSVPCDVFMPCAIGGILNAKTIPRLQCRAVVGCANNQLASMEDGKVLHDRGILYAPDYAVNSAGIINVYLEHVGYDRDRALELADNIFDTTREILRRSKKTGKASHEVADSLAEERLFKGPVHPVSKDLGVLKSFL